MGAIPLISSNSVLAPIGWPPNYRRIGKELQQAIDIKTHGITQMGDVFAKEL